jgi:hypothetical protein
MHIAMDGTSRGERIPAREKKFNQLLRTTEEGRKEGRKQEGRKKGQTDTHTHTEREREARGLIWGVVGGTADGSCCLLASPSSLSARSHAFDVHVGPPAPGDTPAPPRRCCSSLRVTLSRCLSARAPFRSRSTPPLAGRGNDEAVLR